MMILNGRLRTKPMLPAGSPQKRIFVGIFLSDEKAGHQHERVNDLNQHRCRGHSVVEMKWIFLISVSMDKLHVQGGRYNWWCRSETGIINMVDEVVG